MPAGRKPKAPGTTVHRNEVKYPWQRADAHGWSHGEIPAPPEGLMPKSVELWVSWFSGWWAAFWTPEQVPSLELVIKVADDVARGHESITKLVPLLDRFGITPKGQQDLRWAPMVEKVEEPVADEVAEKRQARRQRLA